MKKKQGVKVACSAAIAFFGLIGGGASVAMAQDKLCVSDINMSFVAGPGIHKYDSRKDGLYHNGIPLGIPIAEYWTVGACDSQGTCELNKIMSISVKKRIFSVSPGTKEDPGCLDAVALITSDQGQTAGIPAPEKNGQAWKIVGMTQGRQTAALNVNFSQPMVTGKPSNAQGAYSFCTDGKKGGIWSCTNTLFKKEAVHGDKHSKWIVTEVYTDTGKECYPFDWDNNTYCAGYWRRKEGNPVRLMVKVEPYENFPPPMEIIYTGYWDLLKKHANGGITYEYTAGMTEGKSNTRRTEMSHALSAAFGYEYTSNTAPAGPSHKVSAQLGYTFTHQQANEVATSFESAAESKETTTCDRGQVFQWVNKLVVNNDQRNPIITRSAQRTICTSPDDTPPANNDINWNGCDADQSSGQWRCKQSGDQPKKDGNSGAGTAKSDGRFKKDGNNGTVSCSTYCGKVKADGTPEWGTKTGACVEAKNESTGQTVSCDTVPGLIQDGKQLTCFCR